MEQHIRVSVICNTYNHSDYIQDCLNGFVMQKTNFDFEVLIHDDASTDTTASIIRSYASRYPNLIKPILQTENQLSKHIRISQVFQTPRIKGEYVALCEGDDYWTDPYKLQKQFDFLEAHPDYVMCVSNTTWLNMITGKMERKHGVSQDMDLELAEIISERQGRICQTSSYCLKREVFSDRPNWRKLFPIGDLPLLINARLHGKVRMMADWMSVYRWHSKGSWTTRMDNDSNRAVVCERMIDGFNALNTETGFIYDQLISERIKRTEYTRALMNHDVKAITSAELIDIFKSRSVLYRISDICRCVMPNAYLLLRKAFKV